MSKHSFPTSDQLDRLHAGLLDDKPELKAQVQRAIAQDPEVAGHARLWQSVAEELDAATECKSSLVNQLRLRRREVLSGKRRTKSAIPIVAAVAAASLATVIGVGLFVVQQTDRPQQAPAANQLVANATTESPAVAPASEMIAKVAEYRVQTAGRMDDRIDLANNLDFYVWLANQRQPEQPMPK